MAKRGVLYLHWGSDRQALERSMASLREHHPELPVHVEELPAGSTLLDKVKMCDVSPFEETLYLDCDTVVMGRLDMGFTLARRHAVACCICEHPWAQRYGGLKQATDLIEYNTGVIFFCKIGGGPRSLFDNWKHYATRIDSSITFYGPNRELCRMPLNDQASFARAALGWGSPAVLPLNWNFRPAWHRSWWGPIKVWHDYSEPPVDVVAFTRQQQLPGAILEYRELVRP